MAYDPLRLKTLGLHGQPTLSVNRDPTFSRQWSYVSEDAVTDVRVADYFHDARSRGMGAGDTVMVVQTTAGAITAQHLCGVLTVDADGANLTNGTAVDMTDS